ncbi:TPA: CPBP family intramembrane metalloprotease [Corynebacterium striatum]|nr:CPBP family intramembrane metalloprotease [Corynebacterium striatum]HAT6564888.1 CPBP family intramembrane metalloprotease [Corynebacterium striatum]HAT6570316.1 CPBP family intramembrane metalloprotease [Corynebacterium striatum]
MKVDNISLNRVRVGISAASLLGSVAINKRPVMLAPVSFLCIAVSNTCDIRTVKGHAFRRGLRLAPYVTPCLVYKREKPVAKQGISILAYLLAVTPTLYSLIGNRKNLRILLNREIARLMPEISIEDKVTESAFFLAPSLFQEVYHRGFLPLVVGKLGINNPLIISLISGITFAGEHLFAPPGGNGHTSFDSSNFVKWFLLGAFWQGCTILNRDRVGPSICAHFLLNLPRAIQPFLRRTISM